MARSVVITGAGIVSPIGSGKDKFWDSLVTGTSGVDRITKFDASEFDCKIAAEVTDFDPQDYDISKKDAKRLDAFSRIS
jgi:3-oxoacyl-[acyl-carrier-protein] synthase II